MTVSDPDPATPRNTTNSRRLDALAETELVGSPAEYAFDRLTQLAARLLGAPVALVSLVTDTEQYFKSSVGLPAEFSEGTPLSHSFCQYVVDQKEPLVVEDSVLHPICSGNLAIRDLGVRAYAGVPLTTSEGYVLGSFCVIDTQPRTWSADDLLTLRALGDSVQTEIELRAAVRLANARAAETARKEREARHHAWEAEQAQQKLAALLEAAGEGIFGINSDGVCTFVNPAAAALLGYQPAELLGQCMHSVIGHHGPQGVPYVQHEAPLHRAAAFGDPFEGIDHVFVHRDGSRVPVDVLASPLREDGVVTGAVVVFSNITARKAAEEAVQQALAQERHVAATLQRTILTDVPRDRFPGLHVATSYLAAWQEARIGGDFYDVFALDNGLAAFVVGDASGKGLDAAIRTAEVKFALRAFLHDTPDPDAALTRLNNFVCAAQRREGRDEGAFVALSLVVIDTATGKLCLSTAGAEPPLIMTRDGHVHEVAASGMPVGFMPNQQYTAVTLQLDPGCWLLMATDGITEARQGSSFLGYDGMVGLVQQAAARSNDVLAAADWVLQGAQDFAGGTLHDDACLLAVRRTCHSDMAG